MSPFLITVMIVVAVLIAAGLYRVWAGPTVFDRLIAIALVTVNGVIVLVVLGFVVERPSLFLDIALAYALLAFLLPIALGRYFEERDDGTSRDGLPSPRSRPRPTGVVPHGLLADRGRRLTEQQAAARRSRSPSYPGGEPTPPEAGTGDLTPGEPPSEDTEGGPDDAGGER